ncbi:MAG: glycosyltransferase family 2 protein [Actinomycetota bacterium]
MKVSCICPTYNRPPDHQWLVEEAVESFLRQDYEDKELILLNDCPGQELACDAPEVVVVNMPRRFRSLGEKCNAAIGLATGDVLARWDDDDISMPWRLSQGLELLGDSDYFNPGGYWFLDGRGLHRDHSIGYGHACSVFTRRAFDVLNGYRHISIGEDATMDGLLRAHSEVRVAGSAPLGPDRWSYIYRWGVSPVHLSGRPREDWYADVGVFPTKAGRFGLRPQWRIDWMTEVDRALGAIGAPVGSRGS